MATLTACAAPDPRLARRLVVKIGSALLVDRQKGLKQGWLSALDMDVAGAKVRGADVVLDMVGADYSALNQVALNPFGRWVVIATQSGARTEVDLARLMMKRITLTGSTLRARPADEKARLIAAVEATAWPWVMSGALKPPVEATFPLEPG